MSSASASKAKKKGTADFWRATQFLRPYWRLVVISIACAIFVSAATTGGLSTLLPIMRVLIKGDTIQSWADREIVQRRIGAKFADDVNEVRILSLESGEPAERAGLRNYDLLTLPGSTASGSVAAASLLRQLSNPQNQNASLKVNDNHDVVLPLKRVSRLLALARVVAGHFPLGPVQAIAAAFGVIAGLAVVSNVVKFFQEYLSDKAAVFAVNDIRRRLYDHVLHAPLESFNLRGTSDVTSRLVQDAQGLAEGFKTVLGQSIQEPVKAAMALGLALLFSWKLTLFIIFFAPLVLTVIRKFGKKMRRASKKALMNSSTMLGQIEGSLVGIRVVKGASAERFERRRYARIMDKLVDETLRMSRIDSFSEPTVETMTLLVVGMVVLFASYMVFVTKTLNVVSFFVIMACLASIGDSLRRVSKVSNVLQKSNAAAARIFEVMDLPSERPVTVLAPSGTNGSLTITTGSNGSTKLTAGGHPPNGAPADLNRPRIKLPPLQSEVRFENVTFSYPGAAQTALSEVSLNVPKGQCVAVVGRNGSGKTTLLALLPRFYDAQSGRVLIDGVDIRDVTLRSLRRQISIVTQDSVVFPATIAENIAYGDPTASQANIEAAARRAFAHDFIMEKPQGYQTLLGGLGSQLSGGQKQRLCIARAVFRKSPILVLDEATSQVDAESEHLIQQAIDSLLHERTTFVIAHRFSTILGADTIVVMERGRIVGQGKHDELLRSCETYQQLYERQLGG